MKHELIVFQFQSMLIEQAAVPGAAPIVARLPFMAAVAEAAAEAVDVLAMPAMPAMSPILPWSIVYIYIYIFFQKFKSGDIMLSGRGSMLNLWSINEGIITLVVI